MVRPQPSQDDAVPNANGVFAEALVRLAQITEADEDIVRAGRCLSRLVGIARSSPLGHASILNALDLHLRGVSILVTGNNAGALRDAALALPYLDRSVRRLGADEPLAVNHRQALAASGSSAGPRLRRHALLAPGHG